MESGEDEVGYFPTDEQIKELKGWTSEKGMEFIGFTFYLKDGSKLFVEYKNSIDLEDKSNGE